MNTVPEKKTINISLMNIDSVNQMSYFANYLEGKNKLYFSSKLPNYSIRNLQCSEINIYQIPSLELKYQLHLFPFSPMV